MTTDNLHQCGWNAKWQQLVQNYPPPLVACLGISLACCVTMYIGYYYSLRLTPRWGPSTAGAFDFMHGWPVVLIPMWPLLNIVALILVRARLLQWSGLRSWTFLTLNICSGIVGLYYAWLPLATVLVMEVRVP
jgi:hypothetical protein